MIEYLKRTQCISATTPSSLITMIDRLLASSFEWSVVSVVFGQDMYTAFLEFDPT